MSRRWFGLAGLLVVPALLVAACSGEEKRAPGSVFDPQPGTGGAGGEGGTDPDGGLDGDVDGMAGMGGATDAGICPSVSPNPFCQSCVENLCTDPCLACKNNAECVALLGCVDACPDVACIVACQDQHPTGVAEAEALLGGDGCMATQCELSCVQGGDSGGPTCGIIFGDPECTSCVNAQCRTQCDACFSDPTCGSYSGCVGGCAGDAQCLQGCATTYPTGASAYDAFLGPGGCLALQCPTQCEQ